ncbi:MAG: acetyl-CoA carboxylase biotin carboxylase subunit [Myxococcales bacterium]|nr:acetyl-CoA carboxylase biotin carboxylase subunit [Myxococcales bacterium]USN50109.1 MAG: acetyl-CoA carboxylase biotin carboxylase subunit [Myxococcales bacterium]
MFKRVLVANRGEIARRIIRTLTKMGIESVAIFSEADKDCAYLKEANKSICIGPSIAKESYLCEDAILQAALQNECDALHPGFGFLSENAIFAARCAQQKLSFIGPSPHHLSLMGNKAKARSVMADLGVPTLIGSKDILENSEEALSKASELGYPVLLKARSGGGGKGMRLVNNFQEMPNAFMEASREAQASFNDEKLYVEKYIKQARHIEFQVLCDHFDNVMCLGERECSVQRRNQKLLEETPANGLSEELRKSIIDIITVALKKIGYHNAGTLEFLLSDDGRLYFMEMNTRIQVEHGISELVTGIDIVEWQVRIAANEMITLKQDEINFHGHAIECRINSEDPAHDFAPSPGKITHLHLPPSNFTGPVRIDTYVIDNFNIVPFYDSMLAKVLTHGATREEALALMEKTLDEISIQGIKTTIDFHKAILANNDFRKGSYDCSFIEKNISSLLSKF